MAIPSFYHSSLSENDFNVELDAAEAAHAIKARRLKVGQPIRLFNGLGLIGFGELSSMDRRSASVSLSSFEQCDEPATRLTIAAALPKGDRQKVMLDMLTQLGVSGIIPLLCEYSVSKVANNNTPEKWRRLLIEAAKQSQNPRLPVIRKEIALADLITSNTKPIAYANADGGSLADLVDSPTNEIVVLVGPEGGFSEAEFELFRQHKINAIALGGHILRTEAAAIAVAAQFNLVFSSI